MLKKLKITCLVLGAFAGLLAASTASAACPADSPYTESNQSSINTYCNATIGACSSGYHYPSSLSCDAAPGWAPYGASCTAPSCAGCSCVANAPTVSASASPNPAAADGGTTVSWSSTDATSCTFDGSGVGTSGSQIRATVGCGDRSYNISCSGPGGTASQSVYVVVSCSAVCSSTHYSCTRGTSSSNVTGGSSWTWTCLGVNGGTNASCSESYPYSQGSYYSQPYYQPSYYSQGSYYSQPYYQASYYSQGTYYSQGSYYSQGYYQAYYQASYSYTVTGTASGSGTSITPASQSVSAGSTGSLSATLSSGNKMTVSGCSGTSVNHTAPGAYSYTTGVINAGCTVTAAGTAISGSITSSPNCTIAAGQSTCATTVSWSTTNVTSAQLTGGGTTQATLSGSSVARTLNFGTNTYTLSDTSVAGDGAVQLVQASASATCASGTLWDGSTCAQTTVTITADGASGVESGLIYGTSTKIAWNATNATSCTATNGMGTWTSSSGLSGNGVYGPVTGNTTFTMTCNSVVASVTVQPGAPPISSIAASSTSIGYNTNATVSWSSSNVSTCDVWWNQGATNNHFSTALSGQTTQTITTTTNFNVNCCNSANACNANTVTVTVSPAPTGGMTQVNACIIASGASSCTATSSWAMTNATSPEVWVATSTSVRVSTVATNPSYSYTYTGPGTYTWSADSNGVSLSGIAATISCAMGSAWDVTLGECVAPPTVSWTFNSTPNAANVVAGFGDPYTFSYSSSGATSCDYQNPPGTHLFYSFANTWTNQSFLSSHNYRVICSNAAGSSTADLTVSVATNGATSVSLAIPEYLLPGQSFVATATVMNSGTKVWFPSMTPHRLCVAPSAQAVWGVACSAAVVGPVGVNTDIPITLTAPSGQGDYAVSLEMREEGLADESGPPGAAYTNGSGGYYFGDIIQAAGDATSLNDTGVANPIPLGSIRVKNPSLVVYPNSYTFPDTVPGDPASTWSINVYNVGGGSIAGGNITGVASPFSCTTSCNFTLGAGTSTPVALMFSPSATGTFSNAINVNATSQASVPVTLTGKGIDMLSFVTSQADATAITSSFNFGDAQGAAGSYKKLFLRNRSSSNAGNYSLSTATSTFYCVENCSGALGPNSTIAVKIRFLPPLLSVDSTPVNISGSIPFTFSVTPKTINATVQGNDVAPKLQFKEQ